jgi:hypothetical protein
LENVLLGKGNSGRISCQDSGSPENALFNKGSTGKSILSNSESSENFPFNKKKLQKGFASELEKLGKLLVQPDEKVLITKC